MGSGAVQFVKSTYIPTNGIHRFPKVDGSTQSIQTIEYEHHEIHSGSHFFVAGYGTYAADEDVDFQVTTPATTKWAHMTFEVTSSCAATIKIYESAAVAADGVSVTPINNNRNSNTTSVLTIQTDGTVNTVGSLIYSAAIGAGQKGAGFHDREREIVLKQNTTYRFFIESDAAANVISYVGEWYEHTDAE